MLGAALGNEGRSQPVKQGVLGRRSGENGMQAPEPLRPDPKEWTNPTHIPSTKKKGPALTTTMQPINSNKSISASLNVHIMSVDF